MRMWGGLIGVFIVLDCVWEGGGESGDGGKAGGVRGVRCESEREKEGVRSERGNYNLIRRTENDDSQRRQRFMR